MKTYLSIPDWGRIGEHCIAFEKLDGSNLRFGWNIKTGWDKFGTRTRLFDESDEIFGRAIDIFNWKYKDKLTWKIRHEKIFRGVKDVIVFCEFLGFHSFAGRHKLNDTFDLILFDINVGKKGIMAPNDFLDLTTDLHIPQVVYKGQFTNGFINDVKQGKYPVTEGIVAKGGRDHKLWMCKVKTFRYLKLLQDRQEELSNWKEIS